MPNCGCNNAVKINSNKNNQKNKPKIVGRQVLTKSLSTKCLNYGGYNNNNILLFSNISLNYSPLDKFQYYRIVPNYYRFFKPYQSPVPFEEIYEVAITQNTPDGECLRAQLATGPIVLWSLEEMFLKLVPSTNALPELQNQYRNGPKPARKRAFLDVSG